MSLPHNQALCQVLPTFLPSYSGLLTSTVGLRVRWVVTDFRQHFYVSARLKAKEAYQLVFAVSASVISINGLPSNFRLHRLRETTERIVVHFGMKTPGTH